ncbi:MAG: SDR family oxidoreductase [Candidatus Nanopelagicales bacterium]|nr:SDR family oxidoreductase [Candidatus Nanopelagicales bacterium]
MSSDTAVVDQNDATEPATGKLCLVTGATGYIGGRLVPELLAAGMRVRVFARHPERLRDTGWFDQIEIVKGDANDPDAVREALTGVEVAYFLLHSLSTGKGFAHAEHSMAQLFADTAAECDVSRLVYLGGITPPGKSSGLSEHLRSRAEVGNVLRSSGVPTAELRAAVILGSGSASFEMLRYLTERLPAMITPKWVSNRIQPIAIRDVLRYLVKCADLPPEVNRHFDIGGPDVLTYLDMMQAYARISGLPRRFIVPVPVLTPSLSSHWVGVVTPVPAGIARPLVESLRHEVVCSEHDIAEYIPDPPGGLLPFTQAITLAIQRVRDAQVSTRWSSASVPGAPAEPLPTDPSWAGGSLYTDVRTEPVPASKAALWRVIEGVGGKNGWYSFPFAWEVRGWMDRGVGGVGLRRGRRDPDHLMVGEAVDFWRVEEIVAQRLLRLRAEMKLPGLAWLEFTISEDVNGRTVYGQRATFFPRGLAGHLYWWAVAPFHGVVFGSMVRNITRRAVEFDGEGQVTAQADGETSAETPVEIAS